MTRRAVGGKGAHGLLMGHVQFGMRGMAAGRDDGLRRRGGKGRVHVGHDHAGALPGKALCDGGAQAAPGARHHDALVLH